MFCMASASFACQGEANLSSTTQAIVANSQIGSVPETTASVDDFLEVSLSRQDDPDNCIDWGQVTYKNSIKDITKKYCTKCHSNVLDEDGNPNGYAVAPKRPYINDGLSEYGTLGSYSPSYILGLIDPDDGSDAKMPPPQSEEPMDDDDKERFRAWVEDYDAKEGSELPEVSISYAAYVNGYIRVTYEATDEDSDDAKVALFYDNDAEGFNGTLMRGCLSLAEDGRSTTWNATDLDNGTYYIYGCIFDGDSVACDYADYVITKSTLRRIRVSGGRRGP